MRYRILQEKVETPAGPHWRNLVIVQEMPSGRLIAVGRTLARTTAYSEHLRAHPLTLDEIHRLPLLPDTVSPGAEARWTQVREAVDLTLYRLLIAEEPADAGDSPPVVPIAAPEPPPADTILIPGVQPVAPQPSPRPTPPSPRPRPAQQVQPPRAPVRPASRTVGRTRSRPRRTAAGRFGSCLVTGVVIGLLGVVLLLLLAIGGMVGGYMYIARQLPPPEELASRQATFATTKIYDREGNLLFDIFDPHAGRRTRVPLNRISPHLINAAIATEDRNFYLHPGFDPYSVARAVYYNLIEGEIVSGASTITQQLARNVFLSPEERVEQSASRKIKEIVLAAEITRTYPRETILEIYLNQIFYGNLAYGIEAAAETYFGKSAAELSLAEAALLAGLPQSPAIYDPYTNPEAAKARQSVVLDLMVEAGYVAPAQADEARAQALRFQPLRGDFKAPHFVTYVRQQLETRWGVESIYHWGLKVYTTLDPRLQAIAEQEAAAHIAALADRQATNAALVALDPQTAEIKAMLGSVDFFDPDIDGQVNVALSLRQPGSAIKPVTYIAAFEKGWTPSTLIMDVPTEFPDGANPPYKPVNYDGKFHGPVSVRSALANSYNVPAVKALQFVGLPAMLDVAHRTGIQSLDRPDYGLSLTLGGGEVTLLELTAAYAVLASGGIYREPVAILRIEDAAGRVVYEYQPPSGAYVISPQHAYLITHILADNEARTPMFGPNSMLKLSRPAAAKTGTTNDYRDAWTVGYTPDLVAGVWVGNADNSPMDQVSGVRGAGPIWHNFMEQALDGGLPGDFSRPPGIIELEVCADSGALPSEVCPKRRKELFAIGQPPLGPERDLHQLIRIDRLTGQRATEFCPDNIIIEKYFMVFPAEYRQWAEEHGHPQPPAETCSLHTYPPQVAFFQPLPNENVQGLVPLLGRVRMSDLAYYNVEWGVGDNPIGWGWISGPHLAEVESGQLTVWDSGVAGNGLVTLRVAAYDRQGNSVEGRVQVVVNNPTPTPTPTATVTPTPTATPTPTTTPSGTPTPTATATPTNTVTPLPSATPTVTPVVAPSPTDTPGASPVASPTPTFTQEAASTPTPTPTESG
jgi:1A family penicillin-binding protein